MPQGGNRTSLAGMAASWTVAFNPKDGVFSPGTPITPPDPQPTRVFDFAVGANTNYTPRSEEGFGFSSLRAFANVELVRLAIETRKDQMERSEWRIKPRAGLTPRADRDARIAKIEKFWRKPDGATPFGSWLRTSLEDLLAIDAPAFEKRRNRNGDLIGLDIIPGDTIKLLVDETGRRPRAPAPAFQQIIKGRVWNDLTTDDLIYAPRNMRPNHIYGFGPVEQIVVTINTILRRQSAQLAYFTEGNVPQGTLSAPEGWTPDNIKEFQDWFDARLSGNTAERRKLIWVPFGTEYGAFKEPPLKDEFDEWLARIVAFAFSLPPTPFIKQMNRATAEDADERALEEGNEPLKLWWKRQADDVIQGDLGCPDLEWGWDKVVEIDPKTQAEIDDTNLRNGSENIDEVRARRGQEPTKGGNVNRIYLPKAVVAVETVDANNEADRKAQADAAAAKNKNTTEPGKDDED